jgi:hypothetical protein
LIAKAIDLPELLLIDILMPLYLFFADERAADELYGDKL